MKLAKKLTGAFLAIASIALAIGMIAFYGNRQLSKALEEVGKVRLPSIVGLQQVNEAQITIDSAENALLNAGLSAEARQAAFERIDAALQVAEKGWALYEPLPQTPEEATLWNEFVPA